MGLYTVVVDNCDHERCIVFKRIFAQGDDVVDMAKAPAIPEHEAREIARSYRPPAPPSAPEPPKPTFRRTPRKQDDCASYLGINVGLAGEDVNMGNSWRWHVFHVGHPVMVGAVSVPARSDLDKRISLRLYDPAGSCILATELKQSGYSFSARFDDVRLESGNYLLTWFADSLAGHGSTKNPRVGLFPGKLPAHPKLDDLLKAPAATDYTGRPIEVGMPVWTFAAD